MLLDGNQQLFLWEGDVGLSDYGSFFQSTEGRIGGVGNGGHILNAARVVPYLHPEVIFHNTHDHSGETTRQSVKPPGEHVCKAGVFPTRNP